MREVPHLEKEFYQAHDSVDFYLRMQLFREFMPDVAYQSLFPHRDLRTDVRSRDQRSSTCSCTRMPSSTLCRRIERCSAKPS